MHHSLRQILIQAFEVLCKDTRIKIAQEVSKMKDASRAGQHMQLLKHVLRNYQRDLNLMCGGQNTTTETDHTFGQLELYMFNIK